jgi:hypothetical protein
MSVDHLTSHTGEKMVKIWGAKSMTFQSPKVFLNIFFMGE